MWACGRKLIASSVDIPVRHVRTATEGVADDARWALVERLMIDHDLDLAVRVAGLFALLFAQHLSRVSALRREDVVIESGHVAVRFGKDEVALPPGLDQLVLDLQGCEGHAVVQGTGTWLFPGGTPGRPITAERFRSGLADAGIVLRSVRQAALLQLAGELPAPVLADLLGLHVNTAVEWVRAARGDWSPYAAAGSHGSLEEGSRPTLAEWSSQVS